MANPRTSNSRLLVVGVAVLVVGVLLVLLIVRNQDDATSPPSQAATEPTGEPAQPASQPLTSEQLSTARLPLPLEVPEGTEAVAVRVNFMRSVAAIPAPGDLVNLYRLPEPVQGIGPDAAVPVQDPVRVVTAVEVLAVTGPLPAANDGTLTLVLAVAPSDVNSVMGVANETEAWFTLLPSPDAEDEA